MNFLNEFCQVLLQENPIILSIIISIYTTIQVIIDIKIVKQLLSVKLNKRQKTIWFFVEIISISICKLLLPASVYKLVSIALFPVITTLLLKIDITKTLTVQLVEYIIIFLIESLLAKNLSSLMGIEDYFLGMGIPAYRIVMVGIIVIAQFLVYLVLKKKQIVLHFPEKMNGGRRAGILFANVLGVICITGKFIELMIHDDFFHYTIFIIDTVCLLIAFVASIKHIVEIYLSEKHCEEIEQLEQYNQNLNELYDNVRGFRHDFSNILQAFGGYISAKDIEALKIMYEKLSTECQENNQLSALNPENINNPAIYNIISHKYQTAKDANIEMNVDIWADLQKMDIDTYEFARMLGILLDNAIDAAKKGDKKFIDIQMVEEAKNSRNLVIVRNTYDNKKIDMDRLFEKGYTTKDANGQSHGLGLWEIRKILNKSNNLNLFTTIEGDLFKQQLEIYQTP